jgi:threonine dehydratase
MRTREVRTPDASEVAKAWETVSAHLRPTPLDVAATPALKLESAQPVGSFKVRGALTALSLVPAGVDVVTASAGNHGLGVAYAARLLGRHATVVVPGNASPAKVSALRGYGVELVEVGTSYDEAEEHALRLAEQGAHFLSPYNDPDVIAGQGTIGHELATQTDGPLTVVCAVGGGGLAAGLALWASTRADVRVVGVEAAVSTALSASVRAGGDVEVEVGDSIADGILGNLERGSVTVGIIAEHVDSLVTVTEDELRTAIRYLVAQRGVVAEGAGAAAVAALLAGKVEVTGQAVAVVSGRNIALPTLAKILA